MLKKILKNITIYTVVFISVSSILEADVIELKSNTDYIVTETRSNHIVLVDANEKKVVNQCEMKEMFSPGAIVLAPNNKHAFVLAGFGEEIAGYDITNCERIFHSNLTQSNIKGQSISSIAVSEDSKKVYVTYNRTEISSDRYKVLDPYFSIYNVSDDLNAKAVKSFKIPKQITMLNVAKDGIVYAFGSQLYSINPNTEEIKIAKKLLDWGKEGYSNPDSVASFIVSRPLGDYTTLYTTTKYNDSKNQDGILYWGITSIDLSTNEIVQEEFSEYETLMFTAMRNPKDLNILYGVFNDLTKFDIKNKKVLKRVEIDHTYYGVSVSPDGQKLYLGNSLDDIAIYDANTLEKLGNIDLPGDMGAAGLQVFKTN
jgi:quinohemoprotein amine dehydrogenase beta subunit